MKRAHLLAHLSFPLLFALGGLGLALRREPPTIELALAHLAWGALLYAAPHGLWAAASAAVRPALRVWHAGFVASSLSLVSVGALSLLGSRDLSGLPYQWLVYWPLAAVMLAMVVVGWLLAGRPRASA